MQQTKPLHVCHFDTGVWSTAERANASSGTVNIAQISVRMCNVHIERMLKSAASFRVSTFPWLLKLWDLKIILFWKLVLCVQDFIYNKIFICICKSTAVPKPVGILKYINKVILYIHIFFKLQCIIFKIIFCFHVQIINYISKCT